MRAPRARLRIVYLQPCARLGGAQRQAATTIAHLGRWNIDVVPVIGPTPLLCRWLEPQGVRGTIVSRAFPPGWAPGRFASLAAVPAYLSGVRRLADQVESIVRDGDIDLVMAGAPSAWLAASRVAARLQVPVVWRTDGSTPGMLAAAALMSGTISPAASVL